MKRRDNDRPATKADLAHFATKADVALCATKADVALCATKADLALCATKADLALCATKEDLLRFATKEDLERFATKDDFKRLAFEIVKTQASVQTMGETLTSAMERMESRLISRMDSFMTATLRVDRDNLILIHRMDTVEGRVTALERRVP